MISSKLIKKNLSHKNIVQNIKETRERGKLIEQLVKIFNIVNHLTVALTAVVICIDY